MQIHALPFLFIPYNDNVGSKGFSDDIKIPMKGVQDGCDHACASVIVLFDRLNNIEKRSVEKNADL